MMEHALLYTLVGGYVAIVIGIGTWAIIKARRTYREHENFLNLLKVGDTVMYRNLHFEVLEMNNHYIGPTTAIKIKTEGWLYKEDFGYLRQVTKTD